MITHRELDGTWAECPAPEACVLKFHFPNMTPEQMAEMPWPALCSLMEALDPPQHVNENGKCWIEPGGLIHRDYDLPAIVNTTGARVWYQHGKAQRGGGKPTMIVGLAHSDTAYWHDPQGVVVHEVEHWGQQ